jgi:hypothetical protein
MLVARQSPRASISRAQKGMTGQNPCNVKYRENIKENNEMDAKNSAAPLRLNEQLGLSSMRCSIRRLG